MSTDLRRTLPTAGDADAGLVGAGVGVEVRVGVETRSRVAEGPAIRPVLPACGQWQRACVRPCPHETVTTSYMALTM